jgi:hypothetical protein
VEREVDRKDKEAWCNRLNRLIMRRYPFLGLGRLSGWYRGFVRGPQLILAWFSFRLLGLFVEGRRGLEDSVDSSEHGFGYLMNE